MKYFILPLLFFSEASFSQPAPVIPSTSANITPSSLYQNINASKNNSGKKKATSNSINTSKLKVNRVNGGKIAIVDKVESPTCVFFLQYSENPFSQQTATIGTVNINCK